MLIALDIGNSHVRFGGFCGDDMQFVASIATDSRLTGEQYACQLRDVLALYGLDIGNSHVRFGGFCGDDMQFVASIATDSRLTGEQYACQLRDVLALYGVEPAQIDGVVFCSVAPAVTPNIQKAIRILTGREPFGVASGVKTGLNLKIDQPRALGSDLVANAVWAVQRGKLPCVVVDLGTATTLSGVKTGLNLKIDQPRALGSDLVANAVWAVQRGKLPCVVVDLGTATTFTVLDRSGVLIGTAIAAGVRASLDTLKNMAAQLPSIRMEAPSRGVLGRNTVDAMKSGAVYGAAAGVRASLDTLKNMAAQLPSIRMEAPSRGVLGRNTVDAMKSGAVYGAAAMVDGMVHRIADALGEMPHVLLCGGTSEAVAPYLTIAAECDPCVTLRGLVTVWHKNHKG